MPTLAPISSTIGRGTHSTVSFRVGSLPTTLDRPATGGRCRIRGQAVHDPASRPARVTESSHWPRKPAERSRSPRVTPRRRTHRRRRGAWAAASCGPRQRLHLPVSSAGKPDPPLTRLVARGNPFLRGLLRQRGLEAEETLQGRAESAARPGRRRRRLLAQVQTDCVGNGQGWPAELLSCPIGAVSGPAAFAGMPQIGGIGRASAVPPI
jgi:hypothetical protein